MENLIQSITDYYIGSLSIRILMIMSIGYIRNCVFCFLINWVHGILRKWARLIRVQNRGSQPKLSAAKIVRNQDCA